METTEAKDTNESTATTNKPVTIEGILHELYLLTLAWQLGAELSRNPGVSACATHLDMHIKEWEEQLRSQG